MEGDLQKRSNGPSEIQYSMLQDCGGIENGVITPTDMLSFARQVAMAMVSTVTLSCPSGFLSWVGWMFSDSC